MSPELAALILSGLAIVISVAAILVARASSKEQSDLMRRVTVIEETRHETELASRRTADVRVTHEAKARRGSQIARTHAIVLTNEGPAIARDVDLDLTGDNPARLMKEGHPFPLPQLYPDQPIQVPIILVGASGHSATFHVQWTDDEGPQERKVIVSLL